MTRIAAAPCRMRAAARARAARALRRPLTANMLIGRPVESLIGLGLLVSAFPHTASSGTFTHKFPAAGTFPYFCTIHGSLMTGTVTVTP